MDPEIFLEKGARIVAPKLEPLGYRFAVTQRPIKGSGGPFAMAAFSRPDREVCLWARFDNLRVRYRVGEFEFDHHDHMRALGREKEAYFPSFSENDDFGGFHSLLHDSDYCDEFLAGDAESVAELVKALPPEKTGFAALSP